MLTFRRGIALIVSRKQYMLQKVILGVSVTVAAREYKQMWRVCLEKKVKDM